jgi:hypothetical protein
MWNNYFDWTRTFKGALFWAVFCLFALFLALSGPEPSRTWAILDAVCCFYWVLVARKALKRKANDDAIDLTPEQMDRVKEATNNLHDTLKEVERELTRKKRVAKREAEESSDVQSDQRKDQEAGAEGTDGRTDSKEDRTP